MGGSFVGFLLFFSLGKSRPLIMLFLLEHLHILSFCISLPLVFPKQRSHKTSVDNMETLEYPKDKKDS